MLHLHHSNQTESLLEALLNVTSTPLGEVFAPEIILIQSQGMARWLSQKIARHNGIAANIEFMQPAGFMWSILAKQFDDLQKESAFDREALHWRVFQQLPNCQAQPGFEQIKHYLNNDQTELKGWQLSKQIAGVFDQYLVYRPAMINDWEQGKDTDWQAMLWRQLRSHSQAPHWAALSMAFKQQLNQSSYDKVLPERLSLFAISALSPGYLELVAMLANHIDVHVYIVNPSLNYWGDIVSEKDLGRLRKHWIKQQRPDVSALYTVGNPLLASMGKQARDYLDLFHQYNAQEHEYFDEHEASSLLENIQSDILNLQTRGMEDLPVLSKKSDDSIQVHSCHSTMREVQVLHDQLLKLFDQHEDLHPDDVLVMTPNIEKMAPFVEAVFSTAPASRYIPYTVVGENNLTEDPLVETFLSWMSLESERFSSVSVLSWLELEAVKQRYGLDTEALQMIRYWVSESGIRWGLSGEHKKELGLPAENLNTWQFGLQRLFLGYAMPVSEKLFQGCAPYSAIEGSDIQVLGQLQQFIDDLTLWRKQQLQATTLSEWQQRLNLMIDRFFVVDEKNQRIINQIREVIDNIVTQAERAEFDGIVSVQLLREQISEQLTQAKFQQSYLDGRVTFCDFSLMRAIPFSVICLLGMNDKDFPVNQHAVGFDLIAARPEKGDRSRRDDDRYLFLQAILSAKKHLYLSYVGRSANDDSIKYPSVLVTELQDYIQQGYQIIGAESAKPVFTQHPLQAFSAENFKLGSYAEEWLTSGTEDTVFFNYPLISEKHETIDVEHFLKFFKNPSQYFLQTGLGIAVAEYHQEVNEVESFSLDGLEQYWLRERLLHSTLAGEPNKDRYLKDRSQGLLPHGNFSSLLFFEQAEMIQDFAVGIKDCLQTGEVWVDIDLPVLGQNLQGRIKHLDNDGLCRYRGAKLKAVNQLQLWVEHLIFCASGYIGHSRLFSLNKNISFVPVEADNAQKHLELLMTVYLQGQEQPLPVFPETSLAYAKSWAKSQDDETALKAAINAWAGSEMFPGESADPWFDLAFKGRSALTPPFNDLAKDIFLPLMEQAEK